MVVRYKVIANNSALDAKLKRLRTVVSDFRDEFLQESVQYVVLRSPVDTGTYMESHNIAIGRQGGGYNSSARKPRKQPWQPEADAAVTRMFKQIEGLPKDASNISIYNNALHAPEVEYDHGYGVYTALRSAASTIAANAARRAKSKL